MQGIHVDMTAAAFQRPVAAQLRRAGGIGGRGHVGMGIAGQRADKGRAAAAGGDVAAVQQDVAVRPQGLAYGFQVRLAAVQLGRGQLIAAQHQVRALTMGDDVNGGVAMVGFGPLGDLAQAILAGVQHHHLHAGGHLRHQALVIHHIGFDEHHLLGRLRRRQYRGDFIGQTLGRHFTRRGRRIRLGALGRMRHIRMRDGGGGRGRHRAVEHQPGLQGLQ